MNFYRIPFYISLDTLYDDGGDEDDDDYGDDVILIYITMNL